MLGGGLLGGLARGRAVAEVGQDHAERGRVGGLAGRKGLVQLVGGHVGRVLLGLLVHGRTHFLMCGQRAGAGVSR